MAEYLSPGVYVEEFDSGSKEMEGVGTSTAGFLGAAVRGAKYGAPEPVTSFADYKRRFGGYLPEKDFGALRFMPYAVEQFFVNGGSACYVKRVVFPGARPSQGSLVKTDGAESNSGEGIKLFENCQASSEGRWGNSLRVRFQLHQPEKVGAVLKRAESDGTFCFEAEQTGYFVRGDVVQILSSELSVGEAASVYGMVECAEAGVVKVKVDAEDKTGERGERFFDKITPGLDSQAEILLVEWDVSVCDDYCDEYYGSVSFNAGRKNCIDRMLANSLLINVKTADDFEFYKLLAVMNHKDGKTAFELSFDGGNDGKIPNFEEDSVLTPLYVGGGNLPEERTGLAAFEGTTDVNIMAVPGVAKPAVQQALIGQCEKLGDRFAILDMPDSAVSVQDLQEYRENFDSNYAAMYHPWLQIYGQAEKKNIFIPPSGAVAGIYARTDSSRGVHKAPANEVVRNCTGLSAGYHEAEQGKLNPKGINLIRDLPGQGIRVWGARTCSSDGNWKYVNVRRLFLYMETSIRKNTAWAASEPNNQMLWARVEGTIRVFLTALWRDGALAGSSPDEAFFINIGYSTMTEDDIANGRLICVVGAAPVRPAEFVIFRIMQKMESN